MPTRGWNGRIMFSTVGGGAGSIGDTTSLLNRGFAMASTDTGHEGQTMEFMSQPEATIDYAYRGVHLATLFSKSVVEQYYGKPIQYSYLNGCSNGGRAALMEAIRFSNDYDGIIAGAPAFEFAEFASWMIGAARQQERSPLTREAMTLLDDNSRRACDSLDGVKDGVINDPRLCTESDLNSTSSSAPLGKPVIASQLGRSTRRVTCTPTSLMGAGRWFLQASYLEQRLRLGVLDVEESALGL